MKKKKKRKESKKKKIKPNPFSIDWNTEAGGERQIEKIEMRLMESAKHHFSMSRERSCENGKEKKKKKKKKSPSKKEKILPHFFFFR